MSRTELSNKNKKELLDLAKEQSICGRWNMTKEQLIDALYERLQPTKGTAIPDPNECEEGKDVIIDWDQKAGYIENAKVGELVAFASSTGRVKSGKVVNKSSADKKLKLVTEYGAEFIVNYDDVLWVKTGSRWPRGVYSLLKGVAIDAETSR